MRHLTKSIVLAILLALPTLPAAAVAAGTAFGEGVTLTEAIPVARILAEPEAWVGKRVRIEGEITDVCPMKGCWMEIAAADGDRLRVKVEDGVIVFPLDARGKRAAAEGVVEAIPMTREQYVGWMRHLAEEKGETFDETTITGEGPFRIVRLRGLGARIE